MAAECRRVLRSAAIVGLLSFVSSCAPEVSRDELVGTWEMRGADLKLVAAASGGLDLPRLLLMSDGTFVARKFPGRILYPGGSEGGLSKDGLLGGSGRWWLSRLGGFQTVRLGFEVMRDGAPSAEIGLNVDVEGGSVYLFAWQGEEGSRRLKFRRAQLGR